MPGLADELDEFDDEAPEGDLPSEPEITIEQRARAMGWKPLGEYSGNPRHWSDAESFVRKGEEELPVLRDQNRRMSEKLVRQEQQLETLRNSVEEQRAAVEEATRVARGASEAGYARALSDLKAKQREAASQGELEAFDQIGEQIAAMEEQRTKDLAPRPPADPKPKPAGIDPAITAFVEANPWFNNPAKAYLKQTMIGLHNAVLAEGQIADVADQLVEAKARLGRIYPQDFPSARRAPDPEPEFDDDELEEPVARTPQPRRAAPVLAPTRQPALHGGQRRSVWDRIEATDRDAAREGYAKAKALDPDMPAAEYVELYLNPKADPLEMRRLRNRK